MQRSWAGAAFAGLGLAWGSLRAELPPEAQAAVTQGDAAVQQGEFLQAIGFYENARKLAPLAPEIFYDLGQAEAKIAGRELRAATWLGAYMMADPQGKDADAAGAQIAALQQKSRSNVAELIERMEEIARTLPTETNATNCNFENIAKLQAKNGDYAGALKTAQQVVDARQKESTIDQIAEEQAKAGDITGAQKTAQLLGDWKSEADYAITQAQVKAGDFSGALKTAAGNSNGVMKGESYNAVASGQADAGDFTGARATAKLVADMGDLNSSVYADCDIARDQAEAGKAADAQATLNIAQNTTEADGMPFGRGLLDSAIARARWETGNRTGAQQAIQLAEKEEAAVTYQGHASFVAESIIRAQAATGDFSNAQKTADAITDIYGKDQTDEDKNRAESNIAAAQAEAGDIVGAQKTVNLMTDSEYKDYAEGTINHALGEAGDFAGAQKIAERIVDEDRKRGAVAEIARLTYLSEAIARAENGQGKAAAAPVDSPSAVKASDADTATAQFIGQIEMLNTPRFLDLAGCLKNLPADAQDSFEALDKAGLEIVEQQTVIEEMVNDPAKRPANP